jgi:Fic family protein
MTWNWEHPDWPEFTYDAGALAPQENQFLLQSGTFIGLYAHIGEDDREALRIELISDEAVKTSAIEGEILDRASVQSSLRHQLGLDLKKPNVRPAERGISTMMLELYRNFAKPLDEKTLFAWHRMLLEGSSAIETIGGWRKHQDAMQIVSGPDYKRKVHFEAPPSKIVPAEMKAFIKWFNAIGTGGKSPLPAIARAGIAHLYFESIHPFGDGNGRIGRAISEKSLAQSLGTPALTSLAYAIERKRKDYYAALERNNKAKDGSRLEITDWLIYFARTVLEAQAITMRRIGFYLAKAKFYERFRDQLNPRQDKAIARLFREGIDGFKGGLSAENYISITGTSRATATRDLQDLVEKGALNRTGSLRHTRYWLAFLGDEQDG